METIYILPIRFLIIIEIRIYGVKLSVENQSLDELSIFDYINFIRFCLGYVFARFILNLLFNNDLNNVMIRSTFALFYSKISVHKTDIEKKIKKLPLAFGYKNSNTEVDTYDKVVSYDENVIKIKNKSGLIDLDKYKTDLKKIKHYLDTDYLKIKKDGDNGVKIKFRNPLDNLGIEFSTDLLHKDKIFYGFFENDKTEEIEPYYVDINKQTNMLIVGQSGRGKSVYRQLIMSSIIRNLDSVRKVYMIDEKGGLEFDYYNRLDDKFYAVGANKVMTDEELKNMSEEETEEMLNEAVNRQYDLLLELTKENKKRQQENLQNGRDKKSDEPIFVFFDEFALVYNCLSKDRDTLKKHQQVLTMLNSLRATCRSQNIKLIVMLQKSTSDNMDTRFKNNLQSRNLGKAKSSEVHKARLDNLEILEDLDCNPNEFPVGRFIFLDDSDNRGRKTNLIQSLYIEDAMSMRELIYNEFVMNKQKPSNKETETKVKLDKPKNKNLIVGKDPFKKETKKVEETKKETKTNDFDFLD